MELYKINQTEEIKEMKKEEWEKIVKEKVSNVADREMESDCKQKKKMRNLEKKERKQNKYLTQQSVNDARTIFENRTNMVRVDGNFGK